MDHIHRLNLESVLRMTRCNGSKDDIRDLILSFIGRDEHSTYPLCLVNMAWLLVSCRNWFCVLRVNLVVANDSKVFSTDGAANPYLSKCCGNLQGQYLVEHRRVPTYLSNKVRVRVSVATDFRIGRDIETNFSRAEYRFSACSMLLAMFDAADRYNTTFLRPQVPHTPIECILP